MIILGWNESWMQSSASTGRGNVLENLIWKHQAAVAGSGMSGQEKGRGRGCDV